MYPNGENVWMKHRRGRHTKDLFINTRARVFVRVCVSEPNLSVAIPCAIARSTILVDIVKYWPYMCSYTMRTR